MALKTVGETGFARRTKEAFLGAEFEIIYHSRNGKSTSEKIAAERWNRDKAVCSKVTELGNISLGRALTPAKSSSFCSDTQHCVILGFKRLICLSRSKPEISIKSPSCPISGSRRSFCETGKCLPLKGEGLRLLHTSCPGAVSLGGCPNFVVYYWQSPALLYGIICHITVYKMFPQGTFLCNVYIQYDVSEEKTLCEAHV